MPRFFFDLCSPGRREKDEIGVDFADLDLAYLDAWRAALAISFERLQDRVDPSQYRFEIYDPRGGLVMELPFVEVLRPAVKRLPAKLPEVDAMVMRKQRNLELRHSISAQILQARSTVRDVQATMLRSTAQNG